MPRSWTKATAQPIEAKSDSGFDRRHGCSAVAVLAEPGGDFRYRALRFSLFGGKAVRLGPQTLADD
jgi:hypothetical protein